ncbi:MAG TPA: glycine dehydrogenase (aminomethyl-transferring) [Gammaproteobacteria bacterium]|nr:MAG: glycine dehydrogenase (aminomethyl-transferring) [Gammaproteobacteria bacterium TMED163]HCA36261.1 glycine dehydrogenase (aminomethyl-transferring) [Gammaproteobacteria bacterium]|tara:strand:+ start:1887 stop:4808 length:2922 start_codon:yes stop_codon:yes gene_type:complete
MTQSKQEAELIEQGSEFLDRHIGTTFDDQRHMLETLGLKSMATLINQVVPESIFSEEPLKLELSCSEQTALDALTEIASRNQQFKSFIGQGYYNSYTPNVINRNIFENPAWYTAYTPYQPEISQGRLEAILNYQTMISDLTGMDLANASLLDEATAAAEAMTLCRRMSKMKSQVFFVSRDCLPQTIEVIKTRAKPIGVEVIVGDHRVDLAKINPFGVLLQYPDAGGCILDYGQSIEQIHSNGGLVAMAADLLALVLLKSPGELGADVAIGSSQRFGVPLGFGGPHAAYMATKESFKRALPGRIVGVSIDSHGATAYRLALQTREQHIRRDKATSNICTAQVLLAVMASMYAVYHGPKGLRNIALRVNRMTRICASGLARLGYYSNFDTFFDTLVLSTDDKTEAILSAAKARKVNLREIDASHIGLSLDETSGIAELELLWTIFALGQNIGFTAAQLEDTLKPSIPTELFRQDKILTHESFQRYHSETEMMRYLRRLADKDIALDRAMIPLGSCTMKLNATSEMLPVSWPEFSNIHPFAPIEQVQGYMELIKDLEEMLATVTGYDAVSLQPNAGSQGEYAGLLAIKAYHESRGDDHRNICLIPSSAHGTNPASALMCGMKAVVVRCDEMGNVDLSDLEAKLDRYSTDLAALMVTYPSTHGVFEEKIKEICSMVHDHGGQVFIDGANFNAMVGLCYPGHFGGDVSHLNLHKTFCIPHGGGGPGVGPIGVGAHLKPFLPGHLSLKKAQLCSDQNSVSAAAWGSASILPISWMYIRMMGRNGLKKASESAILNANYIAERLKPHYPVLYTGVNGRVAHECIIDLRPIKEATGITVDDVAKRLIDFGFHAPTMSFPVSGTFMIEPTESESLKELDRFCEAMIIIRDEITDIESGISDPEDNPLKFAPHTAEALLTENWTHSYTRKKGAYPVAALREGKHWPPVGRIDNVFGDRNLICSCPSIDDYEEETVKSKSTLAA